MLVAAIVTCLLGFTWGAPSVRMNGGAEVVGHRYPYQVSIQNIISGNEQECGGAIVSPSWIITAAHCAGVSLLVSKIVAGASNLTENDEAVQTRSIDLYNVIKHLHYSDVLNDIALIKVKEPFEFNDYVQALKISKVPCVAEDETAVFSGFGLNGNKESVLESAEMTIVPYQECYDLMHSVYADNLPLREDIHICVTGAASPCTSDGGGPLVQDQRLIGLLTWLPGSCADSSIPAIFTNTGYYKDFIKTYVDDL